MDCIFLYALPSFVYEYLGCSNRLLFFSHPFVHERQCAPEAFLSCSYSCKLYESRSQLNQRSYSYIHRLQIYQSLKQLNLHAGPNLNMAFLEDRDSSDHFQSSIVELSSRCKYRYVVTFQRLAEFMIVNWNFSLSCTS